MVHEKDQRNQGKLYNGGGVLSRAMREGQMNKEGRAFRKSIYIHGLLSPKPGLLDLDSISPSPSVEGHEEKHASPPFQTTGEHRGLSIQHPPGNQLLELTTWATRNQLNSPCQNLFTVLPSPSLSSGTLWFLS